MYSIVLTDGKIIKIKAIELEYIEKDRMIRLYDNRRQVVARINMDNVVGWIVDDNLFLSNEPQEENEE